MSKRDITVDHIVGTGQSADVLTEALNRTSCGPIVISSSAQGSDEMSDVGWIYFFQHCGIVDGYGFSIP